MLIFENDVIIWSSTFRLSNEITDWVDQPASFKTFDTIQLYDLIDGGATSYNERGLVDGIFQLLKKGTEKTCDIYVYNFGTTQKASVMFTKQCTWVSSKVLITGYDESVAVGSEFIGGAIIYAHFNKFVLELSFGGYPDLNELKLDAALFLSVYELKIGSVSEKKERKKLRSKI